MNKVSAEFLAALTDISVLTPELPEANAFDVLERIEAYEHRLILRPGVPPRYLLMDDYGPGTAREDDDIRLFGEDSMGVLASAEHATDPMRRNAEGKMVRDGADHGTGGLVRLLVERDDVTGIIPVGRQMGNAAFKAGHVIKDKISLLLPRRRGFLSVHGMRSGKLFDYSDSSEIHAIIGLGSEKNELSRAVAESLVSFAAELGLRAIIGNDHTHREFDRKTDSYALNKAGEVSEAYLAGLMEGATTNHANRIMQTIGQTGPVFQVEMARAVRLVPADFEGGWHKDRKAKAMGVYDGYLVIQKAVRLMAACTDNPQ